MKVKELVETLQKFDSELEVYIGDSEFSTYETIKAEQVKEIHLSENKSGWLMQDYDGKSERTGLTLNA